MKTYKASKTAAKGIVESISVAFAVGLTSQVPALENYQELSIIVMSALIRAGLNFLKHRFGFDFMKLLEKQ